MRRSYRMISLPPLVWGGEKEMRSRPGGTAGAVTATLSGTDGAVASWPNVIGEEGGEGALRPLALIATTCSSSARGGSQWGASAACGPALASALPRALPALPRQPPRLHGVGSRGQGGRGRNRGRQSAIAAHGERHLHGRGCADQQHKCHVTGGRLRSRELEPNGTNGGVRSGHLQRGGRCGHACREGAWVGGLHTALLGPKAHAVEGSPSRPLHDWPALNPPRGRTSPPATTTADTAESWLSSEPEAASTANAHWAPGDTATLATMEPAPSGAAVTCTGGPTSVSLSCWYACRGQRHGGKKFGKWQGQHSWCLQLAGGRRRLTGALGKAGRHSQLPIGACLIV